MNCAWAWPCSAASRYQPHSFGLVLENAPPGDVHAPEAVLRIGLALLGGQTEPAHSFGLVLEDTLAGGVHEPEAVLRIGLALLGGQTEPARRFGLVLENCPARWRA